MRSAKLELGAADDEGSKEIEGICRWCRRGNELCDLLVDELIRFIGDFASDERGFEDRKSEIRACRGRGIDR